ncbi:sel1 repeat family protein [Halomonas sp. NyZ770]|uniref:tetratricopeptide repeat protein n=1 Tax=Halomonas sp. NyZ770 TaxID=2883106 RepID=UPI001D0AA639|nr:tetratricopeptide repeat protein [Halomonas sp. NyZ770]UDM06390.1 sel1 repeat family protein [Halomonas sp. NyZ770]
MTKLFLSLAILFFSGIAMADINSGIEAYNEGNYSVALSEFENASQAGDAFGHHLLASLYYQGHGVEKNISKAVALFERAASEGYAPSHANLGLMYHSGDGVELNSEKALFHYSEAAKTGDFQSSFNLGQIFRKGWHDVAPSYEKAASYYRFGAGYGHVPSVNEYGLMFAQGQGVPNDFVESYAWMQYASERGDPSAVKNLDQLVEILESQGKLQQAISRAAAVNAQIASNSAE